MFKLCSCSSQVGVSGVPFLRRDLHTIILSVLQVWRSDASCATPRRTPPAWTRFRTTPRPWSRPSWRSAPWRKTRQSPSAGKSRRWVSARVILGSSFGGWKVMFCQWVSLYLFSLPLYSFSAFTHSLVVSVAPVFAFVDAWKATYRVLSERVCFIPFQHSFIGRRRPLPTTGSREGQRDEDEHRGYVQRWRMPSAVAYLYHTLHPVKT